MIPPYVNISEANCPRSPNVSHHGPLADVQGANALTGFSEGHHELVGSGPRVHAGLRTLHWYGKGVHDDEFLGLQSGNFTDPLVI